LIRPRAHLATLVEDFDRHARDIAIVATRGVRQQRVTYGELAVLTRRFAAELERRAIGKGDRVLVWGENSAEWIAAFFGCVMRGVIPVPVDFAGSVEFVRRVAGEVTPKLIMGDAAKIKLLDGVKMVFEDFDMGLPTRGAAVIDNLGPDDTLQIIFTSGTTGEPKGVVHTHRNVLASLGPIEQEMGKYLKYERPFHPIRILHTLPLSHVFGQFMGLWTPPLMASELHYESRLVAAELAEHIRRDRISVVAAVPRVLDLMQAFALDRFPNLAERVAKAEGLKAWQRWWQFRDVHKFFGLKFWAFVVGGAALSATGEQFWGRMGFVVIQGYGMTETTAVISLNHPFRAAQGTIGQVLPGREVRLSDEGEVLVRGETISNTTWQHGQLQKQESEWLATGDLNLDSLGRVQLQAQLEQQYGIALDDTAVQSVNTQEDVRRLVEQASAGPKTAGAQHIYWRWPWNPIMQFVRAAFIELAAMPLTRFLAKPKVVRRVTRWPDSPALIVCNHLTSYDGPFILYALPRKIRDRVAIAMAGEMLLNYRKGRNQGSWYLNLLVPFAYWLITALFNVFPLPQFSGFRRSFQHAGEAVDRGFNVIVFPEGHRSDDGKPQPFKSGTGLLWKSLGTDAIPVCIHGLGELKVSGERWFRSGKITVFVGEPLKLDPTLSPEELTEQLRQAVLGASDV